MISITVYILSMCICLLVGIIMTYTIFRMKLSKRYTEQSQKTDNAILEVEYRKGIEEGEKKAMEKFSLFYEPFVEITDNFFKRTAVAGYTMQIFYNGLPLGDPMKRLTNHEEKFKDDNLKYLVDSVNNTITNFMLTLDPLGIPAKANKKPKIQRNNKKALASGK